MIKKAPRLCGGLQSSNLIYLKLCEFNIHSIETFFAFGKIKCYFVIFLNLVDEACCMDKVFFV